MVIVTSDRETSLNKRSEIMSKCRHKLPHYLNNYHGMGSWGTIEEEEEVIEEEDRNEEDREEEDRDEEDWDEEEDDDLPPNELLSDHHIHETPPLPSVLPHQYPSLNVLQQHPSPHINFHLSSQLDESTSSGVLPHQLSPLAVQQPQGRSSPTQLLQEVKSVDDYETHNQSIVAGVITRRMARNLSSVKYFKL